MNDNVFFDEFCSKVDELADEVIEQCIYFANSNDYELFYVIERLKASLNKKLKTYEE